MKRIATVLVVVFLFLIGLTNVYAQTFTKIDTGVVATDMASSSGSCFGDYDNDGLMDLYVTNFSLSGTDATNFLYHNEGSGYFTKIESGTIVEQFGSYGWKPSWGDYNSDGYLDIVVPERSGTLYLFQNDGNSGFNRINDSPLSDLAEEFRECSWIDLNRDGYVDLLLGNVSNYNFLINHGPGNFIEVNNNFFPSFGHSGNTTSFFWADYDNDGDNDVFISVLYHSNLFYINNGDGTFTLDESGQITDDYYSFCGTWGDCNNDGFLDLYVANGYEAVTNSLYLNNGDGSFEKVTSGSLVTDECDSYESSWGDFDNDGDLDLFVNNFGRYGNTNCYYQNDGGGEFLKITEGAMVSESSLGNSTCDFDNDGDLDIFIFNAGAMGESEPNSFYTNDGNDNNWINIKTTGTASNTTGIGARLTLKANIFGNEVWQLREIYDRNLRAHFGLGDASEIDSLIVRWNCGRTQVLTNVPVNQFLEITETTSNYDITTLPIFKENNHLTLFTNFQPEIMIKNFGINDVNNVGVSYKIEAMGWEGYSESQTVSLLKADSLNSVMFNPVSLSQSGDFTLTYITNLTGDEVPTNDTLKSQIICSNIIDNFEEGDYKWHADSLWGISFATPHDGQACLRNTSQSMYENGVDCSIEFKYSFDLTKLDKAYISYFTRHLIEPNKDFGYVEVSIDGGQNWMQLGEAYTGVQNDWIEETRSLNDYCGPGFDDVKLRFHFVSDTVQGYPALGWYIDDISIHSGETEIEHRELVQHLEKYKLFKNYPNPFNTHTVINYKLPRSSHVKLAIYNILGQEIRTLVNRNIEVGHHQEIWDGTDNLGHSVPTGLYLYQLDAEGFVATEKMLLLK